jgi:hypothetical protein
MILKFKQKKVFWTKGKKEIVTLSGMIMAACTIKIFAIGVEPPENPTPVQQFLFSGIEPSPTPHPAAVAAEVYKQQVKQLQSELKEIKLRNETILKESKANEEKKNRIIKSISNNLGGVFQGKAAFIYATAKEYDVNPMLLTAIMYHETGNGTSNAVRSKNNPGGLMGSKGLMSFGTLNDGIEKMSKVIKQEYIDKGYTSLEQIQRKYCPIGAANDPTGLNKWWLPNVTEKYQKILSDVGGAK